MFFFGTPHQGLRTAELEEMVDEEAGNQKALLHNLFTQLKEGTEYLENQKEALSRLWEGFHGKVVTFYETEPTKSVRTVRIPHTDRTILPPCLKSLVSCFLYTRRGGWGRGYSRLTVIAGARIIRTGRKRSSTGSATVRSTLFAEGILLSGPL